MSNIEINDFSTEFYEDFREDANYLADNINRTMSDMARRYGGALEDVDRYFDKHRSNFLRLFETIVGTEVISNRARIDDVLKDAILAGLAVCASTSRGGNRDSDDFIAGEFDNNPFLRDLQRSSRHDDRGRDRDRGGSRYGRRNTVDYHTRRDRSKTDREDTRRTTRRRSSNVEAPRGRIAAITKPNKAQETNGTNNASRYERAERKERVGNRETRETQPTPTPEVTDLKVGDVVTSQNFNNGEKLRYGLAYIAGDEQVVYNGETLEVEDFLGSNEVDYEQHRIDRFYPDILGDGNKTNLTEVALREAEKVKDQTIKRFVNDPANPEASAVADPKLFQHAVSGSYEEPMRLHTHTYHPIDLRNNILEDHGGTTDWFDKHALFVKADQVLDLGNISNDAIEQLRHITTTDKVLDMVGELIKVAGKIDPFVWRLLHDYITTGFNKRLISLDLNVVVSSITADWTGFRDWLKDNRPELAETLNHKNGITSGLSVESGEEGNFLVVSRNTLYLPIGSYDLDFASATADQGFAVVNEETKIFKFINQLMANNLDTLYISTLDGQVMAVRDLSGVMGVRYFITKE